MLSHTKCKEEAELGGTEGQKEQGPHYSTAAHAACRYSHRGEERRREGQEARGVNSVATLACKDKPLDGFHKNRTWFRI